MFAGWRMRLDRFTCWFDPLRFSFSMSNRRVMKSILILSIVVTILVFPVALGSSSSCVEDDQYVWSDIEQRWMLLPAQSSTTPKPVDRGKCVWPEDGCAGRDDRIIDQLRLQVSDSQQVIKIFPPHAMGRHFQPTSREENDDDCLNMNLCKITYDLDGADVVLFPNADVIREPTGRQRKDQIWIAYLLESPPNTFPDRYQRMHRGRHEFNWTASYRRDSDIVSPYAKFVPYYQQPEMSFGDRKSAPEIGNALHRELIRGKGKKVAWFASNCHTANKRLEYANELSKYIQVDIYGKCGSLNCVKWNQTGCLEMLNRDYKFYLSFENSNTDEYITEKLFRNALGDNNENYLLLPIVMGPPRSDYERLAPPNSFIHLDDFSGGAEELANYLKLLDSNDALYYSYFSWKTMGRFVDTKFMCRVCLLAHETIQTKKTKIYRDLKKWYRNSTTPADK